MMVHAFGLCLHVLGPAVFDADRRRPCSSTRYRPTPMWKTFPISLIPSWGSSTSCSSGREQRRSKGCVCSLSVGQVQVQVQVQLLFSSPVHFFFFFRVLFTEVLKWLASQSLPHLHVAAFSAHSNTLPVSQSVTMSVCQSVIRLSVSQSVSHYVCVSVSHKAVCQSVRQYSLC